MRKDNRRYDTEALRTCFPVTDVIARYGIELRASGTHLLGRCPLHTDSGRPNLHVYPLTQSWYCYRCGVGGDVIKFLQLKENIDFLQACALLDAQQAASASQPTTEKPAAKPRRNWERLGQDEQVLMNTAAAVYQHTLWQEPRALEYVRGRGIPDWLTREAGLGYADGHSLEMCLRRHSGIGLAVELGLLKRVKSGTDKLRQPLAGRIVVPEKRGGQCIWFIGRTLQAGDQPKYLALPGERPVLGYERAAGKQEVVLCEGVFDYLTALSWKLAAFSTCGTQLPAGRLGFLAGARVIYAVFDGDDAGRDAAARFNDQLGSRVRPLHLPESTDLNDLGRQSDGRTQFFELLGGDRAAQKREAMPCA